VRILFLSFYFRPDLSAGSFRSTALAEELARRLGPEDQLEIITTLPNRYRSFSVEAPPQESAPGMTILRVRLPPHRGGMVDQALSYLTFAKSALRLTGSTNYDLIIATSGRLFTAVLASWIARRKLRPLYLDIRDIFADTISEVLPRGVALVTRPTFGALERWTLRRASVVNLVSRGFTDYFEPRYPGMKFTYHPNGIDEEFLGSATASAVPAARAFGKPLHIVYAGNLGESQALHLVLPGLARRLDGRARITVIGDGGRRGHLEAVLQAGAVRNVEILSPMKRAQLLEHYRAADILFLHLADRPVFRTVLPSKIFEYAATGKPILAGVAGHAANFLRNEVPNSAIFAPCSIGGALEALAQLRLETAQRTEFVATYSRHAIVARMAGEILLIASAKFPRGEPAAP